MALGIAVLFFSCILPSSAMAIPQFTDTGIPDSTDAGQPIQIWVNITSDVPIKEVLLYYKNPTTGQEYYEIMALSEGNTTNGRWIFGIPSQSWKGKVECRITAWDNASASTQYNAIIEIIGDDPPKPFPWNWVLIIAFLGVALVVTELVFKPGLYRATGREKAKALEEEDRRREQEESEKET
jgi:hypothetical protein